MPAKLNKDDSVAQDDSTVKVTAGDADRQTPDTVVALELDGPARPDICT